jgi:hypothetical protein
MAREISEALMEMHFHHVIVEHFQITFGAHFLSLFKPSPRREVWVGFDQGWTRSEFSQEQLFGRLAHAVQTGVNVLDKFYIGFFLQFKNVERMRRLTGRLPAHYKAPYLRSKLSLRPNALTRFSQHETLLRLSKIANTSVAYACPMFFDAADVYEKADLQRLRCVPLDTAPAGWATNQTHFITFENPSDQVPFWCSRPKEGKALSFAEWASPRRDGGPEKITGHQAIELIEQSAFELASPEEKEWTLLQISRETRRERPTLLTGMDKQFHQERDNVMPESFTLMEFSRAGDGKK